MKNLLYLLLVLVILRGLLVLEDWLSVYCICLLLVLISLVVLSIIRLLISALNWSLIVWVLLVRIISHWLIGLL